MSGPCLFNVVGSCDAKKTSTSFLNDILVSS